MAGGLIAGVSTGTLSGFGWDTIAALCPLGALGTTIATKTMIPRAVISLVIMAALVLLVGRAFCAWLCPTTLIYRIRDYFRSPKKRKALAEQKNAEIKAISQQELDSLKPAKDAKGHACGACGKCQPVKHGKLDSRHAVLGGALLSTAVFGFPVFCLVCPVGLTFATVLVLWRAFSAGDATIGIILIPAMLIIEIVFLRKWCTRFCPLSAEARGLLDRAMARLGLSARAYDRIIKVARTIADLDGAEDIAATHISEAINYRSLDREEWGR